MADVISVTNSDSAFDASKGVTRTNLPPFAQRLRKAADLVWEEGYRQPFIRELGEGTLPREKFAFYLLQDFRYLNDYARVHALGLAKTDDPEIMAFMLNVQNGALNVESTVHRTYLASYGITDEQMNNVRQSAFARAYTSNILSIAYGKGILDILVAVLPCAWVYADYGYRLAHEFADTLDVNQYKSWVDMYKTDEFWQGSAWLIEHIEKLAAEVRTSTCSGPARTTCSTRGSPNGIRRADSPARSLPIVYFHMKRPAFRLVSEGGPLHITFGSLFAHETNVLHVVTLGTTVEHETVADDLHEFRAKLFGETFAGLLGGQTGTVEHGAFDELALLDGLVRLFDGVFAQIVLADLDERIEFGGQAAQLLDLLFGKCHMCSIPIYKYPLKPSVRTVFAHPPATHRS